ncbi:MAG TPA: diguanylate cyclase [Chloroflexota bacterium]|nr:diguanylate cyclase [Chloroflexota bacterium]
MTKLEAGMARARVLVADDSQTSLALVRDFLERSGYEVVTARDGLEAIEAVYRENPDLVVLDVVMPRMTGYQVCRMLKLDEQTQHIPVVMLTSRDQPADQYWGLQTGADCYVTKEQPLPYVLEAVGKVLAQRPERDGAAASSLGGSPFTAVDLLSRVNDILDRKLLEATILGEVTKLAWSATDLDKTTEEIMTLFAKLFDFSLACMLVRGDNSREGELVWMIRSSIASGDLSACEDALYSSQGERSGAVIDRRAVKRRIVVAPGARVGADVKDPHPVGRYYTVPLGSREQEAGVFAIWGGERTLESEESLQMISMLANAAYLVLDNARLYQEMRRLATTDELTGLANYRQFEDALEREFQRSLRTGEPMAVLMMDLDNFKGINDVFGHKMGDTVLHAVGSAFMGSARQYDIIARYGGEEFAVILPGTGARGAIEMGERLRLLVRTVGGRLKLEKLSTSVGVALYPNGKVGDAQDLVREADAALYRAKAEGKDRVWLAAIS